MFKMINYRNENAMQCTAQQMLMWPECKYKSEKSECATVENK